LNTLNRQHCSWVGQTQGSWMFNICNFTYSNQQFCKSSSTHRSDDLARGWTWLAHSPPAESSSHTRQMPLSSQKSTPKCQSSKYKHNLLKDECICAACMMTGVVHELPDNIQRGFCFEQDLTIQH